MTTSRTSRGRTLWPDLRWGLSWSLALATGFSAWVLLLTLFRGSTQFHKYDMTTWQIIATYYVVSCVGGIVLGLCRPFTAKRWGATVVGALIGTLAYTGVGISMDHTLSTSTLIIGVLVGVPAGAFVAYRSWDEE